jgi:hypothetical protein
MATPMAARLKSGGLRHFDELIHEQTKECGLGTVLGY